MLDADRSSIDLPDGAAATLTVDGGTVSGVGPCNSYRGSIQVDGSSVTIGSLAETMMACDQPLMDAQDAFTAALRAAETAEVDGDTLVLTGADDTTLTFTAVDPTEQVLGDWDIVEVAPARRDRERPGGHQPTLTFAADGTMAVDTSCNTGVAPTRSTASRSASDRWRSPSERASTRRRHAPGGGSSPASSRPKRSTPRPTASPCSTARAPSSLGATRAA